MLVMSLDIALTILFFVMTGLYITQLSSRQDLPPGPRPLPVLGNAHHMPLVHAEKLFAKWKGTYGDIIFLQLFNTPVLVVNSQEAARELMEKRSTKYSDRPRSVWMTELLHWDANVGLMQYGETFRKHRRWIQAPLFDKSSLAQLLPVQIREMHTLLSGLLDDPDNVVAHLHRFSGSIMLESLYGHRVTSMDDECLRLIDKALEGVTASPPGTALVDFFPILRHVPAWLPSAGFKRLAKETKAVLKESCERTYALAEATKGDKHSIIGSLIKEYEENEELASQAYEIMMFGSAAYAAGTDTTRNVLHSFILAMVLHPEVLKRAQQEMDAVVGRDRLPTLQDRDSLPYLECILKETYRWACPLPLGLPHASREDDEYRGYFIPKGTTIIPNLWLMLQDSEDYPEPESFLPGRFWELPSEESERIDPRNVVFGHGRRICPGRRFADVSVWLAMANLIATFDICKARDTSGSEITPPAIFESGLSSFPVAFPCSIRPRSPQAVELITSARCE